MSDAPSWSIPSPSQGVWDLGPVPIRGYALCIIAGIVAAIWIGERRWVARGGEPGEVSDLALWAVPFGLVGGRLYHVAHRLRSSTSARAAARSGALRLARRPRRLGRDRDGRARRGDRRQAEGHQDAAACWTRWRPACWSPRRSAAGATGSTRSCSAGRPTCRGRSRSTRTHRPSGLPRRTRRSTRRSSTSRCGTCGRRGR